MNKAYQWSTEHNIIRVPNIPSDTPCCIRWSKTHFTRKGDQFWDYVLIIYLISLGCLLISSTPISIANAKKLQFVD